MINIFKYLRHELVPAILIFVLLMIQAFCDLALPQYTSDIVNVGISKYGIDNNVPEQMTKELYDSLLLLLDEDAAKLLSDSYELTSEYKTEAYKLREISKEKVDLLSQELAIPMAGIYSYKSMSQVTAYYPVLEAMPQEARQMLLGQTQESLAVMGDAAADSIVAQFIIEEKNILGVDPLDQQNAYMLSVGLRMILMSLGIMCASIAVGFLASRVGARIGLRLRTQVFEKVLSFSNGEIDKFSTASLITRSTNDIQQVQQVTVMILRMVLYAPILAIGGIIRVNNTKTGLAWLIVLAVVSIACLVVGLMIVAMPKFKKIQELVDKVNLVAREILTGIPVIRAFSREEHEEDRFDKSNSELTGTQLFTQRVMTFMMPSMNIILNFVTVGIIWFGGRGIEAGRLQVGDMMAFMTYTMQIIMSFLMLTMLSIMLPRAGVAANRIAQVLETKSSINDREQVIEHTGPGEVKFTNVDFMYPDAKEKLLEDITFTAKPGETTAIIGGTGTGKSTLVNLLPRFYDVTDGSITIDGVDIRDMSQHQLREIIGYVPQKAVLFSGTISSNIGFGVKEPSKELIMQAAEIAQAKEFVEAKELQYEEHIAQGGTNVSGGQKQRLSIARAVAKKPKIYIFDDSFSALDYKTDVTLRKALKEETGDATVIIVAQRISTILHAENIIVLDDGRIVGQGTHSQLMAECEVYRQIAKSQLSASDLEDIKEV